MGRTNSKRQLDTNSKRQRAKNRLSASYYRQIARRKLLLEQLEDRSLLAALLPYQNAADHFDVDADGDRDVRDAYVLDMALKEKGEGLLAPPNGPVQYYVDVNGDNLRTFADLDLWMRNDIGTVSPSASDSDAAFSELGSDSGGGTASSMMCGYSATLYPVGNVNEGQSFYLNGYVTPPGSYQIMGSVNWGVSPGSGSGGGYIYTGIDGGFSVPHIYWDDGASPGNGTPSDNENITLDGTIMGCPVSGQTTGTVNNVAPAPPQFSLFNTPDPLGGPKWKVGVSVQDVGVQDYETVTINWGDGSVPTVVTLLQGQYQEVLHEFPPWELHEAPGPYMVTASISDDDTGGAAWGPAGALMYVLDIDNDANNNGLIEPADDPIEYVPPGRFVLANLDDNNLNGIADYYDPGPVLNEDDLEEFKLRFAPTIRQDVLNYDGWKVTLDVVPGFGAGPIWETADKTGAVVLPKVWIVGTDSIPPSLYLEAGPLGGNPTVEHRLQLRLTPPDNNTLIVDTDEVVFTATGVLLDLDIGYGQSYEMIEDEKLEFTEGSFTVANINDTDGDGTIDWNDTSVKHTIQGVLYEEMDLMPLVIYKPDGYDPAKALTLTVEGAVRFWKEKTKEDAVDINAFINTWGAGETEKTVWIEADTSQALRDIKLELKYPGAMPDKVSATAIWAQQTAVEHDKKTAAKIFEEYPHLVTDAVHSHIETQLPKHKGTGLQLPPDMIENVILIEFTITPLGIHQHAIGGNRHLSFDISRRMDVVYATTDTVGNPIDPPDDQRYSHHFPFPDNHPDAANDDPDWQDESEYPDFERDRMYVLDAPGIPDAIMFAGVPEIDKRTYLGKFEEFVRVKIKKEFPDHPDGGTNDPVNGTQDPIVDGSRLSEEYHWSVRHTLESDGTKLKRTTGDDNETDENYVREGHPAP